MIINNLIKKTVVKNKKRIKFKEMKLGDLILYRNVPYKVIQAPYLSINLPEGTYEAEIERV